MNGLKQLIDEQKNNEHFDIIFKHVSAVVDEVFLAPKTIDGVKYTQRRNIALKKDKFDDGLNKTFKELNELRQKMNSTDSAIKKTYYRILENIKFAASAKNKINYEWKFHDFDFADEASKFTNKKIEVYPDTPIGCKTEYLDNILKANKKLKKEIYRKNTDFKYAAGNNKWKLPAELLKAEESANTHNSIVNSNKWLEKFTQNMKH